jgi:RNA ligase (TIGR02306 family)
MKIEYISCPVGEDITSLEGVKKYFKQIPLDMQGEIYGEFPQFIPKTDEPNYQTVPDVVESLVGKPYYISQKMDGTSSTAYRYKGHFGVCSRNWELKRDENNALWKIAIDHDLENKLPEGYAIQWETCGPKIQSNMAGLKEIEGFAFNIYDIEKQERLYFSDFNDFTDKLMFPICRISGMGEAFNEEMMHMHAERLTYDNGQPHEGVVVRSQDLINGQHISFKCINLNYEN